MKQELERRINQQRNLVLNSRSCDVVDIVPRFSTFYGMMVTDDDGEIYDASLEMVRGMQALARQAGARDFSMAIGLGTKGIAISYLDRTNVVGRVADWNEPYVTGALAGVACDPDVELIDGITESPLVKVLRGASEVIQLDIEQTHVGMRFVRYGRLKLRPTREYRPAAASQNT